MRNALQATKHSISSYTFPSRRGVTLVEIVIAMLVLSLGVLATLRTFGGISKTLQYARYKTVAATLAQEAVQVTKQLPYYRILPSTVTVTLSGVAPAVTYGTNFPVEDLYAAGVSYRRYTLVEQVMEGPGGGASDLVSVDPLDPDTGLKRITVSVVWTQLRGEQRSFQVVNVIANPNTVMKRSSIGGQVVSNLGVPIQGASVFVAEYKTWRDVTDAAGNYRFTVSAGTYTLVASAPLFKSSTTAVSVAPNGNLTTNFTLSPPPAGQVLGAAWINSRPVVSQVSASTGGVVEYVELFNPTTYTWTFNNAGTPAFDLIYSSGADVSLSAGLTFVRDSAPAGGYFLIANAASVNGVTADAFYAGDKMTAGANNGSLMLRSAGGVVWDQVGWKRNAGASSPPYGEPPYVTSDLDDGEILIRHTSTDTATSPLLGAGNAYDSGKNANDLIQVAGSSRAPRNALSGYFPPHAGVPAVGAVVAAMDGLSISTKAYLTSSGGGEFAAFRLLNTATGTWKVIVSSGNLGAEIDQVTVTNGANISIPSSLTAPAWNAALMGPPAVLISSEPTSGFISGRVLNTLNVGLPSIQVVAPGVPPATTGSDGSYNIAVPSSMLPGNVTVIANPDTINAMYVTKSTTVPSLTVGGAVDGMDFFLSPGGRVTFFISGDGTSLAPIGGIAASLVDNGTGFEVSQAVSDITGYATVSNLPTGSYTIQPVLDTNEVSQPASRTATVSAGATVFAGTFTVQGSLGVISGFVRENGGPIRTGTLVVASTYSVTTPPTLSSTTMRNSSYFAATTDETGFYRLQVIGSTIPYVVQAFYTKFSGPTPSTQRQQASTPATVPQGGNASRDISW